MAEHHSSKLSVHWEVEGDPSTSRWFLDAIANDLFERCRAQGLESFRILTTLTNRDTNEVRERDIVQRTDTVVGVDSEPF